ncbi:CPBP family intramembrane glutamic endopeptidase [Bdellovibrio svalbardensis]|nr:CPBP family intramembrane glutamic endopeptidase [Bdellovibrio svalbardensis]
MLKIRRIVFQGFELGAAERILFSHLLIVLEAAILVLPYLFLKKLNWIDGFHVLGNTRQSVRRGTLYGLLLFVTVVPVALYFGMRFSFQFSLPGVVGNLFSNGAEEVIYRGILFSAALSLFRKPWLAVAASAFAFGFGHWDFPYLFQAYIVAVGFVLGWLYLRTKSLLAPYIAHMIADILADSFFH